MKTTKRTFTRDFKLMVVREVAHGDKKAVQVCREYNIASSVYDRWRQEYISKGEQAFQDTLSPVQPEGEKRIVELERFCGQLSLENDLLKKVLRQCRSSSVTP